MLNFRIKNSLVRRMNLAKIFWNAVISFFSIPVKIVDKYTQRLANMCHKCSNFKKEKPTESRINLKRIIFDNIRIRKDILPKTYHLYFNFLQPLLNRINLRAHYIYLNGSSQCACVFFFLFLFLFFHHHDFTLSIGNEFIAQRKRNRIRNEKYHFY